VGIEPTSSCFAGSRLTIWLQRRFPKYPRQELNLVYELRGLACVPAHSKDKLLSTSPRSRTPSCGSEDRRASITLARQRFEHPDLELNQDQNFRKVSGCPLHHRDRESRRLDLHQHEPLYKSGAFLNRATSAGSNCWKGAARGVERAPPAGWSPSGSQPDVQKPLHHAHQVDLSGRGENRTLKAN
jgi:hypothetical protein